MDKNITNLKRKKRSKKSLIIIIVALVVVAGLIVMGSIVAKEKYDIYKNNQAADELNQASVLPYKILAIYDSLDEAKLKDKYNYLGNFMSKDYRSKNSDELFFFFSGYPTDEDDYHLTYIKFSTKKYNVFGITVGDTILEAEKQLPSNGFKWLDKYLFKNGDLNIELESTDDKTIDSIEISADTIYLGNRIY